MPRTADVQLSLQLQALAKDLDEALAEQYGSRVGFVLLLAPFDQAPTEVQYVSNTQRTEAIDMIRKLFERWQLSLPDTPTHEKH